MKRVIVMLLGLSSAIAAQASPLSNIIPFKRSHSSHQHTFIKEQSTVNKTYTDFTGKWTGQCRGKEGDADEEITNNTLLIENNFDWIKISNDDSSEEYAIGKDLSEHKEDENGFSVSHGTFNWINTSTLVFNLINIDNHQFPYSERSIDSEVARVTFTLQHDTLIMHSEMQHFENDEDTIHFTGTCEYVRQ